MLIAVTYLLVPALGFFAYTFVFDEIADLLNFRTEGALDILIIVDLHKCLSEWLNGSVASFGAGTAI